MTNHDMPQTGLIYNGTEVRAAGERLNLTDMWKAAGSDPQKTPAKWRDLPSTIEFTEHVALIVGKSDSLFVTKEGRKGRTEAHWQIGLAYAKYLSPEFHMWCNTVVRERMEGKPTSGVPEEIRRTDGISRMLAHKVTGIEKEVGSIGSALMEVAAEVQAQVKMLVMMGRAMEEQDGRVNVLAEGVRSLIVTADSRVAAIESVSALEVAKDHGVPPTRRRGFCNKIGNQMANVSKCLGAPVHRSRETGKRLFSLPVVEFWLNNGGRLFIATWKMNLVGQGVLTFPKPKRPRGHKPNKAA